MLIQDNISASIIEPTVDLHLHTTASDGTFPPTELVRYAKLLNIKTIAITDHDSVNGIKEAMQAGKQANIEIIPGIELSTEIDDISVHIVGLFVNYMDKRLLKLTKEVSTAREMRAKKIVTKINSLGLGPKITFQEVQAKADGIIGRPHIAELLISKGFVKTIDEAFEKYLDRGAPCYVPRYKLTPQKGITFLKKNGAVTIIAHPGLIPSKIELEEFLKDLIPYGLDGIEAYYPTHNYIQTEKLEKLAIKLDLVVSGGSDCHGLLNNGPFVGSQRIPYSVLQKIKDKFNK